MKEMLQRLLDYLGKNLGKIKLIKTPLQKELELQQLLFQMSTINR
jgi:hypothetical protein